jgi:hypothetical protein
MDITILIPNTRPLSPEFRESIKDRNYVIMSNNHGNVYYDLLCTLGAFRDYKGFVYFLEDDDMLSRSFPKTLDLEPEYDGIVGNYLQAKSMEIEKDHKQRLITTIDKENFQLSQCIFRYSDKLLECFRDIVPCKHVSIGCVHNDYFIHQKLNLKKTNNFLFVQGSKGDNISTRAEKNFCKGCKYNKGF